VTGRPVDEVNADETVQLLEKTADGAWYRITDIRGKTGWVSVTLLKIDPDVAKQVPIAK
jgi:flagellar FliL protein